MVEPDIELGFVQLANRLIDVVDTGTGVVGIRVGYRFIIAWPMGLIRLAGILLQAVPGAWLPSGLAGSGFPALSHWK